MSEDPWMMRRRAFRRSTEEGKDSFDNEYLKDRKPWAVLYRICMEEWLLSAR